MGNNFLSDFKTFNAMIILFAIIFLAEIATDLYVPSMPMIASEFSVSEHIVQMTMSLHLLGFALGQPIYGWMADKLGKGAALLAGLLLFLCANYGCAQASDIHALILFRFLQGLGACAAPVVGLAMIKDRYDEPSQNMKMIACLSMVLSCSPILGPLLGSWIAVIGGWRSNFHLLCVMSFGCLCVLGLRFQKDKNRISKTAFSGRIGELCTHPILLGYALVNGLLVSIVWLFITVAPLIFMHHHGLSIVEYSYCQIISVLGYIFGGILSSMNSQRWSRSSLLQMGMRKIYLSMGLLALLSMLQVINPVEFTLLIALFECGLGIVRPVLVSQIMQFYPSNSGISSAVIGVMEMLVSFAVISLLGLFNENSLNFYAWGMAAIAACSMILLQRLQSHADRVPL
jgi:DHA1 family bicyclomycin/chloramphenicol resistance-like MFS transporter